MLALCLLALAVVFQLANAQCCKIPTTGGKTIDMEPIGSHIYAFDFDNVKFKDHHIRLALCANVPQAQGCKSIPTETVGPTPFADDYQEQGCWWAGGLAGCEVTPYANNQFQMTLPGSASHENPPITRSVALTMICDDSVKSAGTASCTDQKKTGDYSYEYVCSVTTAYACPGYGEHHHGIGNMALGGLGYYGLVWIIIIVIILIYLAIGFILFLIKKLKFKEQPEALGGQFNYPVMFWKFIKYFFIWIFHGLLLFGDGFKFCISKIRKTEYEPIGVGYGETPA